MLTVVLFMTVALFLLKILWNLLIPIVLGLRLFLADGNKTKGVSMAPFVEAVLLLAAFLLSLAADGSTWLHNPRHVGLWGLALFVSSYAYLVVVGGTIGWFVSKVKASKRRANL